MSTYGPCPTCGGPEVRRVRYTWWGGFVVPLFFRQGVCQTCGFTFHIKTARSRIARFILYGFLTLVVLFVASIVYVGAFAPDTKVLPGQQVPARFMKKVRALGVLESDEEVRYFYADGLYLERGFYLVTDRKVVVYSNTYKTPAVIVPYSTVRRVDAIFSTKDYEDSLFVLSLADGREVYFPASAEAGGDRRVYEALLREITPGKHQAGITDSQSSRQE